MTHLVEVHASFIGTGKSKFINKLVLPHIDNCVDLISCFGWYHQSIIFNDLVSDEITKALLVLEHNVSKILMIKGRKIILASRSPVLSAFQFLSIYSGETDIFINYYKKRLSNHVEKVTIFDYGDAIFRDDAFIELAYKRMVERNRQVETNFFIDLEYYKKFFYLCEKNKHEIVDKLKKDPFFNYIKVSEFNGFNFKDLIHLWKNIIEL